MVQKATKKPVTIEFVEWTGENLEEVLNFTGRVAGLATSVLDGVSTPGNAHSGGPLDLWIETSQGIAWASVKDLIIKDENGEFHPCEPDIFAKTYTVGNGNYWYFSDLFKPKF